MNIEEVKAEITRLETLKATQTGNAKKLTSNQITDLESKLEELEAIETSSTNAPSTGIKLEAGINYSFTSAERAAMIAAAKSQLKGQTIGKTLRLEDGSYSVIVPSEEKVHGFRNVLAKTNVMWTLTAIKCNVRGLNELAGKEYSFGLGANDALFVIPEADWNIVTAGSTYNATVLNGRVVAIESNLSGGLNHE